MKIKKFIYPIIQFTIIIVIGSSVILGTSFLVNKWKVPDIIIQKEVTEKIKFKYPEFMPCKLSVQVRRDDNEGGAKDNFIDKSGVPMFLEFLLDGQWCHNFGAVKSQTTYGFENGEVFFELYKLPWEVSDNFNGENKSRPVETFNLGNIKNGE